MNFTSWQTILVFKMNLNMHLTEFDYGRDKWPHVIGADRIWLRWRVAVGQAWAGLESRSDLARLGSPPHGSLDPDPRDEKGGWGLTGVLRRKEGLAVASVAVGEACQIGRASCRERVLRLV